MNKKGCIFSLSNSCHREKIRSVRTHDNLSLFFKLHSENHDQRTILFIIKQAKNLPHSCSFIQKLTTFTGYTGMVFVTCSCFGDVSLYVCSLYF